MNISDLWNSGNSEDWHKALERYWPLIQERNLALERYFEDTSPNCLRDRISKLDARGWYDFLETEYFRWKYTAPNRYASTTVHLRKYLPQDSLPESKNFLHELNCIKNRLLCFDTKNIQVGLEVACSIRGLGTAGASGLLALMYPDEFGTVDQFVVKALIDVVGLPEEDLLESMTPEGLSINDGVTLIRIFQKKAASNNEKFGTKFWSPRKIEKILWTYGRSQNDRTIASRSPHAKM